MVLAGPTDTSNRNALLTITIVAIALHVVAAFVTIDIPGDGPARATWAYRWSQSRQLISYGLWPPGLTYLAGLLCMLIPNPRIAPRLLNIIVGSASIPLLYVVTRYLFGASVALTAAALLAVFPLHIGLSASSLTEAIFVCGVLAMLCTAFAIEHRLSRRTVVCVGALLLLGLSLETIRYEAWLLAPMIGAYAAYRSRRVAVGVGLTLIFLVFPLWWSLQNYWFRGDALANLTLVMNEDGSPASPFMATYVPLYAPDLAGRAIIIAPMERDGHIRDFFRRLRPSLLVTRADDTEFVRRLELLAGNTIGAEHLVTTIGQLRIFDIRHLNGSQRPPFSKGDVSSS